MQELKGKTAVVTGAASGIGKALAAKSCAEGMNVVMADVEEDALAKARDELGRGVPNCYQRGRGRISAASG
jgi:NADP-dependent 3-hydroxy acid dehydrogenase YdfG